MTLLSEIQINFGTNLHFPVFSNTVLHIALLVHSTINAKPSFVLLLSSGRRATVVDVGMLDDVLCRCCVYVCFVQQQLEGGDDDEVGRAEEPFFNMTPISHGQ